MSRALACCLILLAAGGFAAVAGPPSRCGDTYTVVRGDTVYRIARRCRSSVVAIAEASRLGNPNRIEIGDVLAIPPRERSRIVLVPSSVVVQELVKPDEAPAPVATRASYAFQPTDTLYSLARWANVDLRRLLVANPGIDPAKIEIGDPIRLPVGAADPLVRRARERGDAAPVLRRRPAIAPMPMPAPAPRLRREAPREEARPARDDDKPDETDDPERGPTGMW
jgi:LysM repeat protein